MNCKHIFHTLTFVKNAVGVIIDPGGHSQFKTRPLVHCTVKMRHANCVIKTRHPDWDPLQETTEQGANAKVDTFDRSQAISRLVGPSTYFL